MATSIRAWYVLAAIFLLVPVHVHGLEPVSTSTPSEIQQQIDAHNSAIDKLNQEIVDFQKQLDVLGSAKQTLQGSLKQIELSRKKVTASISITKNRISALQLEIEQLSRGIANREESIQRGDAGLVEALQLLNESEQKTLIESILSSDNLSKVWNEIQMNRRLQDAINVNIKDLSAQKSSLTETKKETEGKHAELVRQKNALVSQQGSLDALQKAQSNILAQTKSKESNYQALLKQKQSAKAAFEDALTDLQAQLQYAVDLSKVTPAGKGILHWPVDAVTVTQKFGNTAFAKSGAYNGKGHNGIDLRATIGTPIKAALTGVVSGTGNTDSVKGCYSYGKWVLVKHGNGLSTLYAHLSEIKAYAGQSVATGEILGYSGETGYATGPHLHFGVYAASGVQIITLGSATKSKSPCSSAIMPVAPLSGYLDPLLYL